MLEALDLAKRGSGDVEPNPRTGALMITDGEIVGRGWHQFYGGPHAEVMALQDAHAKGAKPDTAVITLEPCSSQIGEGGKKTPPCTGALLAAGIRRVIVGAMDPDPRHRRRGLLALEQQGVEVVEGVLADRCLQQNQTFLKWLNLDRPWTIAKWAMTLDGKTAAPTGESRWITGIESRRRTHELRARCDAVVVGFRTAQIDDPELTVRHVEGRQPVRIVVDPRAEIDDDSNLVRTANKTPTWLLVADDVDAARAGHLQDLGVQVIHVKVAESPRHIHLREAWRELRRRGLRRIVVEGGGGLVADLLGWSCVDQVQCFLAPKLIGGRTAPTPVAGEGRAFMAEAWQVSEWTHCVSGDDLLLSGFLP